MAGFGHKRKLCNPHPRRHIMPKHLNVLLVIGALLSASAAVLHLLIIVGGPNWYRFFGAGERLAVAAANGHYYPALITSGIAVVLSLWSIYALAGAGAIRRLPLLRTVLVGVTTIYVIRGIAFVPAVMATGGHVSAFAFWSSAICLAFGIVHLVGLIQRWPALRPK